MANGKLDNTSVINEIRDLHLDLQNWVRGNVENDFTFISKRQAIDLTVIGSNGKYETRDEFNKRYMDYFGKYRDAKLSCDIVRTKRLSNHVIMTTYRQTTKMADEIQIRLITAIFKYNPNLKNHTEWMHVHVTRSKLEDK